ncbi:reverse transcriptase [Senna tora]|uniref:Reverse transcriptase n=1 Tax=Senna tora TaxID=362788 RepID=A0A834X1R6_9FABA|nr:reverse transcriptase [Senna tora]
MVMVFLSGDIDGRWVPPSGNVVKVNCDASFLKGSGDTGIGVVLRNCDGMLIGGRSLRVKACSVEVAEALAFKEALCTVIDLGFLNVSFESDCRNLVVALLEKDLNWNWKCSGIMKEIFLMCGQLDSTFDIVSAVSWFPSLHVAKSLFRTSSARFASSQSCSCRFSSFRISLTSMDGSGEASSFFSIARLPTACLSGAGLMAHIIAVRAFPPSEDCKILVSFELRYGFSWFGFLKTMVCSSKQSQAIRSYMACSFRFNGLIRTVTSIFSSRTLGPPGVEEKFLCILDNGVAGVPTIAFLCRSKLQLFTD